MRLFRDAVESSSLEVIQELTVQSPKQPSNSVLNSASWDLFQPKQVCDSVIQVTTALRDSFVYGNQEELTKNPFVQELSY